MHVATRKASMEPVRKGPFYILLTCDSVSPTPSYVPVLQLVDATPQRRAAPHGNMFY